MYLCIHVCGYEVLHVSTQSPAIFHTFPIHAYIHTCMHTFIQSRYTGPVRKLGKVTPEARLEKLLEEVALDHVDKDLR
jgi:hypothetical protein